MLIAGILHFWLNWGIYWSYLWKRTSGGLNQKREMALALGIVLLIAVPGFFHDGSAEMQQRLGGMTIQQIADRSGKPADQLVTALKKEGFDIHDATHSITDIAKDNAKTPTAILAIITREVPEIMRPGPAH
jgi:hypothetical protein